MLIGTEVRNTGSKEKTKPGQSLHTVFILKNSKAIKIIQDSLKSSGGKKNLRATLEMAFTQEVKDQNKIYRNRKAVKQKNTTTESHRGQ